MVTTQNGRVSRILAMLTAATLWQAASVAGPGAGRADIRQEVSVDLSLPSTAFGGLPCLGTVYLARPAGERARSGSDMTRMSGDERKRAAAKALSEFSGFAEFDLIKGFAPFAVEFVDVETNRLQKVVRPPRGGVPPLAE